jgi:hypothetical protein
MLDKHSSYQTVSKIYVSPRSKNGTRAMLHQYRHSFSELIFVPIALAAYSRQPVLFWVNASDPLGFCLLPPAVWASG